MDKGTYQVTALLLAGLCGLSLTVMGSLTPTAEADTTVTLYEHDTEQHMVDHGSPGPGPGDQFIFAGDVFDRPGGIFLGRANGICTTLTGDDKGGQTTCSVTFNLDGGQVAAQGMLDSAALFVSGNPNPLFITGGTGIYRNARGDGTIQVPVDVPDQTDANFVLDIVTP